MASPLACATVGAPSAIIAAVPRAKKVCLIVNRMAFTFLLPAEPE
jgi:hypothetical protein